MYQVKEGPGSFGAFLRPGRVRGQPSDPEPQTWFGKEGGCVSSHDELIGDTLAMMNVVRRAYGKEELTELPEATRADAGDCLFWRALSDLGVKGVSGATIEFSSQRVASVAAQAWGTDSRGPLVTAPPQVSEVVSRFDSSLYPHYVGSRERE